MDTAQDNVVQPVDTTQVQQPQTATQIQQATQSTQSVSVPVGGKEYEAVSGVVAASHPEVVVSEQVQEAGVESHPDPEVVQLTPDQQKAGIQPAKEATPLPLQPTLINLPIPEEKMQSILKRPNPTDSITWLATLLKKILTRARSKKT